MKHFEINATMKLDCCDLVVKAKNQSGYVDEK